MLSVPPKDFEDISVSYAEEPFFAVNMQRKNFVNIVELYFSKQKYECDIF